MAIGACAKPGPRRPRKVKRAAAPRLSGLSYGPQTCDLRCGALLRSQTPKSELGAGVK